MQTASRRRAKRCAQKNSADYGCAPRAVPAPVALLLDKGEAPSGQLLRPLPEPACRHALGLLGQGSGVDLRAEEDGHLQELGTEAVEGRSGDPDAGRLGKDLREGTEVPGRLRGQEETHLVASLQEGLEILGLQGPEMGRKGCRHATEVNQVGPGRDGLRAQGAKKSRQRPPSCPTNCGVPSSLGERNPPHLARRAGTPTSPAPIEEGSARIARRGPVPTRRRWPAAG